MSSDKFRDPFFDSRPLCVVTGIMPVARRVPRWSPINFYPRIPLDLPKNSANVAAVIEKKLTEINQKPMKSLHLVTAVLASIAGFHSRKANFSAYDITRDLREKANNGEVDILDVARLNGGSANVGHDSVRSIVQEVFSEKLIPDYDGAPYYDAQHQVSYHLYTYQGAQPAPVPSAVPVPVPAVNVAPAAPLYSTTVQSALKQPDTDMWVKVMDYIKAKRRAGTEPSMKDIQSRLKGYKVTCQEIKNWLVSRGYTVFNLTGHVSQNTVSQNTVR